MKTGRILSPAQKMVPLRASCKCFAESGRYSLGEEYIEDALSEAEAEQDGDVLELPDKGLYDDAPPESPEYEKTQNLPSGEEAVAPQPEAPVAREETEQETAVSDEREPDKD